MSLPLQGKRILVTRPAAQAEPLVRLIAAQGGEPVCFPLLEIGPADDAGPLQRAIEQLQSYALAVFISPNAVDYSIPRILAQRAWPLALPAAATGPGTAARLAAQAIGPVVAPRERFDSEALLELAAFQPAQIAGRRVLILRGNGGRELLAATLRARGADVDAVTCYHRSTPVDGQPLLSLLRNKRLDALTISSSEGLRNLLALLDTDAWQRLRSLPVFAPHARIAEAAAKNGLQGVILTAPADAGIIASLCAYNWPDHER
ncbi:MAG: uroporphyrinogen-III synthase [Propionivibrio sp.]